MLDKLLSSQPEDIYQTFWITVQFSISLIVVKFIYLMYSTKQARKSTILINKARHLQKQSTGRRSRILETYIENNREKIVLNGKTIRQTWQEFQKENSMLNQPGFKKINPAPMIYFIGPYLLFFYIFQSQNFGFLKFPTTVIPAPLHGLNNFGNHQKSLDDNTPSALWVVVFADQILVRILFFVVFGRIHRIPFVERTEIRYVVENQGAAIKLTQVQLGEDGDLLIHLPDILELNEEDLIPE